MSLRRNLRKRTKRTKRRSTKRRSTNRYRKSIKRTKRRTRHRGGGPASPDRLGPLLRPNTPSMFGQCAAPPVIKVTGRQMVKPSGRGCDKCGVLLKDARPVALRRHHRSKKCKGAIASYAANASAPMRLAAPLQTSSGPWDHGGAQCGTSGLKHWVKPQRTFQASRSPPSAHAPRYPGMPPPDWNPFPPQ